MDKPAGPTSHDVVDAVRRAYGTRRVGHAGTLDPFATGLLAVLLGRATRLARFLAGVDKTYEGVIVLGVRTDTDDGTGAVEGESVSLNDVTDDAIAQAAADLTGRSWQRPPAYSAKKVEGERSYRRARRGERVELGPREIHVYQFATEPRSDALVRFRARVSAGTYVRALARDLGERLGCGAHLGALRRTAAGPFSVADAVPLAALEGEAVTPRPPRDAVQHLPTIEIDEATRSAVVHGRPVPAGATPAPDGPVALTFAGALVAVAESQGELLKPRVVLVS